MEKVMCYGALGVAGLLALLFLVDLIAGFPFGRSMGFITFDILGLVAAGIVGFLGFSAMRDLK